MSFHVSVFLFHNSIKNQFRNMKFEYIVVGLYEKIADRFDTECFKVKTMNASKISLGFPAST